MTPEKRKLVIESFNRSSTIAFFKGHLAQLEDGKVEIVIPKQNFLIRKNGQFTGAAISSLVDVATGYAAVAAQAEDAYFTTVEMKINFLNPAFGEQLKAKAEVIKKGSSLTIVRADIYSLKENHEHLVATSLVTMMQLKHR